MDDWPQAESEGPWHIFMLLIWTNSMCTISSHAEQECCRSFHSELGGY